MMHCDRLSGYARNTEIIVIVQEENMFFPDMVQYSLLLSSSMFDKLRLLFSVSISLSLLSAMQKNMEENNTTHSTYQYDSITISINSFLLSLHGASTTAATTMLSSLSVRWCCVSPSSVSPSSSSPSSVSPVGRHKVCCTRNNSMLFMISNKHTIDFSVHLLSSELQRLCHLQGCFHLEHRARCGL